MNGYTFYVSNKYEKHQDKRNECIPAKKVTGNKSFYDNKITFQVKDPIPIDYIDKMDDKEREMNLQAELIVNEFLKNSEPADSQSSQKNKS